MIRAQNRGGGPVVIVPVMTAMDTDGNGELSGAEVLNAPNTLVSLDANDDGMLSGAELAPEIGAFGRGRGRGGEGRGRRGRGPRGGLRGRGGPGGRGGAFGPTAILDNLPVMATLDADGNSELSSEEIADAVAALIPLDADGDGRLRSEELMPVGGFGRGGRGFGVRPGGRGGFGRRGRGQAPQDPNVRPPEPDEIEFEDGAATIPDRETFASSAEFVGSSKACAHISN